MGWSESEGLTQLVWFTATPLSSPSISVRAKLAIFAVVVLGDNYLIQF